MGGKSLAGGLGDGGGGGGGTEEEEDARQGLRSGGWVGGESEEVVLDGLGS